MKEEEAKTKWCPMAGTDHARVNKRCIASDCMMWIQTDNEGSPTNDDHSNAVYFPAGHCGLARQA